MRESDSNREVESINYKAFYDDEYKVTGFLASSDDRTLPGGSITIREADWLELIQKQGILQLDSSTPDNLTKLVVLPYPTEPEPQWILDGIKEAEKKAAQQGAMQTLAQMQALTMAATMPKAKLLGIKALFPEWEDLQGAAITKINTPYVQYQGKLYLVNQDHTPQIDWPPSTTASLYSEVTPPGSIAPWVQPLGAHDAYNKPGSGLPKSDPVTHNGKTWKSAVNANIWKPGVYGWIETQ